MARAVDLADIFRSLNNLFSDESVGFGWAVRASAFLVLGCLVISQLLMRDRFKELGTHAKAKPDIRGIVRDSVFQLSTAGLSLILLGTCSASFPRWS
jgi:hypothetical protein